MTQTQAPASIVIIKKKVKSGHGGHHGGAWKVAYADFVTAMMAFFLLMWLLNATTEEQRKGLADYFNPAVPIAKVSGGGDGALYGDTVLSENSLIRNDIGATDRFPIHSREGGEVSNADTLSERFPDTVENPAETERLNDLKEKIESAKLSADNGDLAKHIQARLTPKGLLIELVDVNNDDPLFALGSARPSQILEDLLFAFAPVLATVENRMSIEGHTDSLSFNGRRDYSNWELSSDRANSARRLLIKFGFPDDQVAEVTGKANTEPILDDPRAPQNRRIALTLLRANARANDAGGESRP